MTAFAPELKSLLVIGASARAAAASIQRAGLKPLAADMFCDSDLRAMCQCTRLTPYPDGAKRLISNFKADAWMYVGGLENHPQLVGQLAERLPLLGNSRDVLKAVRDPWQVVAALRREGISAPEIMPRGQLPQVSGWLCKPIRSCGGKGVFEWRPSRAKSTAADRLTYRVFQKRIPGQVIGAVFVADGSDSQLLGVTRQLVGTAWLGAGGYMYAGSIGPVALDRSARRQLSNIGAALTAAFQLRGIFEVDAIDCEGKIWPIEVNPRYAASVEVLERALDISSILAHVPACQGALRPLLPPAEQQHLSGKAILYAREPTVVSSRLLEFIERTNSRGASTCIADIPTHGERLKKGSPVVTLLVDAQDDHQVLLQLQHSAHSVQALLDSSSS